MRFNRILPVLLISFSVTLLNKLLFIEHIPFIINFFITFLLLYLIKNPEKTVNLYSDNVSSSEKFFNRYMNNDRIIFDPYKHITEDEKELITDLSHELASPLSRMDVAVDIIESQIKAGEMPQIKIVEKLSKNVREMASLVKDMLEVFGKYKNFVMSVEKINMTESVTNILCKYENVIEKKSIKVNFSGEKDINYVYMDRVKIEKVIEKLLLNAINYTPCGGEISIDLKSEKGDILFSIKDSGSGIEETCKDRIFEPFFRGDSSRNRNTGGTGLGLAIARKMINLHRGNIMVEKNSIKGAGITFNIPCNYH